MTAQEIRTAYLRFFEERGHKAIPRALLVPNNDPTTLFTGSGMQPLVPYLLGEPHPKGTRLVDSQTCLRAQDIEEVGDNRHTTFFEMLGNWSLGDYFKAEQIPWFWEFLVDVVGLDPKKLYVTCFIGSETYGIDKDMQSGDIWKKCYADKGMEAAEADAGSEESAAERGMKPGERIFYYDAAKNWWCRNGKIEDMPIGEPGGPSTEVFYEFESVNHNTDYGTHCHPNCDCGRFVEIGNNVIMEYVRTAEGFEPLPKKNIDFGGGLERIAAAAIDSPDVFKISVMWPIVEKLQELSGKKYDDNMESMRVIADHLRGAMFLAVDGVKPSNKAQGYVMRRLMRRAILKAFDLGVEQNFVPEIAPIISGLYKEDFPEVMQQEEEVVAVLVKEEKAFKQTLRKGLRELENNHTKGYFAKPAIEYDTQHATQEEIKEKMGIWVPAGNPVKGELLFKMYDTYGFPLELSLEESEKRGWELNNDWKKQYEVSMKEQRERSQTAAKGTFKGGLGGQTMQHKKYHTATHLMYQALRDVLGDHVVQHGSNITEERLRFDFSHPDKMTPEQIKQVEDIVNEQIQKDLQVSYAEYPTEKARGELGALGQFGDRYGDVVKVYSMKDQEASKDERPFSFEICGGPHVDHTMQLAEDGKKFKITKEQSSSAGIRRVKAVLS